MKGKPKHCPACHGKGAILSVYGGEPVEEVCSTCGGRGTVRRIGMKGTASDSQPKGRATHG